MARQEPRKSLLLLRGCSVSTRLNLTRSGQGRRAVHCTLAHIVAAIECRYSYRHPVTGWYLHEGRHAAVQPFCGITSHAGQWCRYMLPYSLYVLNHLVGRWSTTPQLSSSHHGPAVPLHGYTTASLAGQTHQHG